MLNAYDLVKTIHKILSAGVGFRAQRFAKHLEFITLLQHVSRRRVYFLQSYSFFAAFSVLGFFYRVRDAATPLGA